MIAQRLGHMFVWIDNGLGRLLMLVGLLSVIYAGWSWYIWDPEIESTGYEVVTPDGKRYTAVGLSTDPDDAQRAVLEYRDERHKGSKSRFGTWVIFPIDNQTDGQKQAMEEAQRRVRTEGKRRKRENARNAGLLVALLTIVSGVLIVLLGQGLRYIFVGYRKAELHRSDWH